MTSKHDKVSAVQIHAYIKGVDYPVNKMQLVEAAKKNGAPDNVMRFLNRLPERQYNVPTDVEIQFGRLK
jgi:hypothetical protein